MTASTATDQDSEPSPDEQALLIYVKLADDRFGEAGERWDIFQLEDLLRDAVEAGGAGECDGHAFGEGYGTIYLYGPSAERLFHIARPVLRRFSFPQGSFACKRFGPPGSADEDVDLPLGSFGGRQERLL